MIAEIPYLPGIILQYLSDNYQRWAVRSNRASMLGHPCERHLVYARTRPQDASKPAPALLSIFEEGAIHETAVIREIEEKTPYKVLRQQASFEYPEHQITGSIDGQLLIPAHNGDVGEAIPFDVKSASPYTWRELDEKDIDTLRNHKHYFVRGNYDQAQLYMLMGNKERFILIFKDKTTGLLKQMNLALDLERCEALIQKADRINVHIKAGTLPDRIPYEESVCGKCDWFGICLPDEAVLAGLAIMDDPELGAKLRRREELAAVAREYDKLDTEIKDTVKRALAFENRDHGEAAVGTDWLIQVRAQPYKGYTVKDGIKQIVRIQRLGKTDMRDDT